MIKIGIDASNIISGGGLTHLYEILNALDFEEAGVQSIEVWSNKNTLSKIKEKIGLSLRSHPYLEGGLIKRFYWQKMKLPAIAKKRYDILYIPGGSYLGSFSPFVTMNRNLQPFDEEALSRYDFSFQKIRLYLLKNMQAYTYKKAEGVIFLSEEAKKVTLNNIEDGVNKTTIVPHGIAEKFFQKPKNQRPLQSYTIEKPFRILYASTINVYKHQWHVMEAVHALREQGYPIALDLIGTMANAQSEKLFSKALNKFDPEHHFITYHGKKTQNELQKFYDKSDAAVFASSCETFGQILLESMASALPIACAKRSAMPEILKDNGLYFDPEKPDTIADALRILLGSRELRQRLSNSAYEEAKHYSWEKCAKNTFEFIKNMYETK